MSDWTSCNPRSRYEKDFAELLDREILLARATTFKKIFQYLIDLERDFYHIVETGIKKKLDIYCVSAVSYGSRKNKQERISNENK